MPDNISIETGIIALILAALAWRLFFGGGKGGKGGGGGGSWGDFDGGDGGGE